MGGRASCRQGSGACIDLHRLQNGVIATGRALLTWLLIPLQSLEPCMTSQAVRRRQKEPWFVRLELPPVLQITAGMAVA